MELLRAAQALEDLDAPSPRSCSRGARRSAPGRRRRARSRRARRARRRRRRSCRAARAPSPARHRERADRHLASPFQRGEKRALGAHGAHRRLVVRAPRPARACAASSARDLHRDRSLPRGRQPRRRVEVRSDALARAEPVQSRRGEDRRVHLPLVHLLAAASARCRAARATSRSGRTASSCARRRRLDVPTREPRGSRRATRPSMHARSRRARRADPRARAPPRRPSPSGDSVGRSLSECTAAVDLALEQRRSRAPREQPLRADRAAAARRAACRRGLVRHELGARRRARSSAASTSRAWRSASSRARVPMRTGRRGQLIVRASTPRAIARRAPASVDRLRLDGHRHPRLARGLARHRADRRRRRRRASSRAHCIDERAHRRRRRERRPGPLAARASAVAQRARRLRARAPSDTAPHARRRHRALRARRAAPRARPPPRRTARASRARLARRRAPRAAPRRRTAPATTSTARPRCEQRVGGRRARRRTA